MNSDTRVVSLKFDNTQFKKAVSETLASLEKLNEALDKANKGESLKDIASNVNLSPIEKGVQAISNRFSTLGIVGMTVIQRLTNAGIDMGKKITNVLDGAVNQIKTGGLTRALNIEQAKFLLDGLGADVESVMKRVDNAVTGTAYSLDEAAKSAATMFASGITDGAQMERVLKTLASTAAMTGSQWTDVSDIFTTIAGQGKLMTEQLRMFEGRGLNVAALISKQMGVTEEEFRDMVTKSKITADDFFKYMEAAVGDQAQKANDTYSGALANMKTSLSRIGAKFYEPGIVFARDIFNQMRLAINSVSSGLDDMARAFYVDGDKISKWVVNILASMEKLGITKRLGDTIGHAYNVLVNVLENVRDAFLEAFPNATLKNLNKISKSVHDFMFNLQKSTSEMSTFKNVLVTFFNILKIGWNLVKGFVTVVSNIFRAIENSTGLFNKLSGGLSAFTGFLSDATAKTKIFENISKGTTAIIEKFAQALGVAARFIKTVFGDAIENTGKLLDTFLDRVERLLDILSNNLTTIFSLGGMVGSLGMAGGAVKGFLTFIKRLTAPTEALGTILTKLGKTLNDILKAVKDGDVFNQVLSPLTKQLAAMQKQIKADALEKIAIALFLMAAALMMIASLDTESLARGLAGLTGSMALLMGGYAVMMKIMESVASFNKKQGFFGSKVKAADIAAGAASMILIAGAILILAKACTMLAKLDVAGLAKGLSGIVILLGAVFGFLVGMSKLKVDATISKSTGIALIAIAASLLIMAKAVSILGGLDHQALANGLSSLLLLLGAIFGFIVGLDKYSSYELPKGLGLTILAMAGGMLMLAKAVQMLGSLSLSEIAKGIGAITVFLGEMILVCLALSKVMNDKTTLELGKVGTAMLGMAAAMWILSQAMVTIAGIGAEGMVSSLLAIGSAMFMFATVSQYMDSAASGAKSMIIMATAIGILAIALKILASMSLEQIARSLLVVAGALVIMAGVAALLSPLEGVLMGIASAMLMMGGSVALVGAGILMLASGLAILAATGTAAISTLISMLSQFIIWLGSSITDIAKIIAIGLVTIFQQIVAQAPAIIASITQLIGMIILAIDNNLSKLIECGMRIVLAFLDGVNNNIRTIASLGASIIAGFINGVSENTGIMIQAGMNLMLSFINGLADGIRNNADAVRAAVLNLCMAILEAFCTFFGIASPSKVMEQQGVNLILGLIQGIKNKIESVVTTLTKGMSKALKAVVKFVSKFLSAGKSIISNLISGVKSKVSSLASAFTSGLSKAVSKVKGYAGQFLSAGKSLVSGIARGIRNGLSSVISAVGNIASRALKAFKSKLGIKSPSRAFMKVAQHIPEGIAKGINKSSGLVTASIGDLADKAVGSFATMMSVLDSDENQPTITPVLDLSEIQNGVSSLNDALGTNRSNVMKIKASLDTDAENMTDTIVRGIKEAFADQNSGITEAITEGIYTLSTPLKQGMVEAVDGMGIAVDGRQFGRVVRRSAGI